MYDVMKAKISNKSDIIKIKTSSKTLFSAAIYETNPSNESTRIPIIGMTLLIHVFTSNNVHHYLQRCFGEKHC